MKYHSTVGSFDQNYRLTHMKTMYMEYLQTSCKKMSASEMKCSWHFSLIKLHLSFSSWHVSDVNSNDHMKTRLEICSFQNTCIHDRVLNIHHIVSRKWETFQLEMKVLKLKLCTFSLKCLYWQIQHILHNVTYWYFWANCYS